MFYNYFGHYRHYNAFYNHFAVSANATNGGPFLAHK